MVHERIESGLISRPRHEHEHEHEHEHSILQGGPYEAIHSVAKRFPSPKEAGRNATLPVQEEEDEGGEGGGGGGGGGGGTEGAREGGKAKEEGEREGEEAARGSKSGPRWIWDHLLALGGLESLMVA
uniref:Uncharacterized protein n=1 Tax=Vespula pensylvanica TaxID=30213 RepID=A0A834K2E6_VESPE|nr:hypothetical protein H0235_016105 [Vespula pensylvanica]